MLATSEFTHLTILNLPTKLTPPRAPTTTTTNNKNNSLSFSFSLNNNKCYSQRLNLSCELITRNSNSHQLGKLMGERGIRIPALGSNDNEDIINNIDIDDNIRVFEQANLINGNSQFQSYDFESILNRLSKWFVAAIFGAIILWRHDAEAVWVAMGSVLNSILSVVLKRVLNQERPLPNMRSDPGMPSSHAQSIFFTGVFVVLSMVEWLGLNEFTLIFAAVALALGSYFSWLRVAQQFHTVSQVLVGATIGLCFSLLWVWSWYAFVGEAFSSILLVRVSILLGSALCCLGILVYVVLNWFTDER